MEYAGSIVSIPTSEPLCSRAASSRAFPSRRPAGPTHEASRRVLGRRRAVATGAADRHVRRKRARLRHRGDGRSWADGARPSQGDRRTLMAVRHPDIYGRALPGRSADDGATDAPASRRPHLRARSTPTGRSGPLLRAPLAGAPARAHQRLPGLPGAPRRSATQAGRLLPHGAPGNAHRALPGQLVALRRVHGGLKDGSWSARRTQRAPLAAAGTGRDWAGSSTTTRGRRAGGFSRTRWLDPRLGRETVDPPGHVGIMGAVGHEPRPRATAASRPSHSRPGGRLPRPCRLATWQERSGGAHRR